VEKINIFTEAGLEFMFFDIQPVAIPTALSRLEENTVLSLMLREEYIRLTVLKMLLD
jgi:hypothetical protein